MSIAAMKPIKSTLIMLLTLAVPSTAIGSRPLPDSSPIVTMTGSGLGDIHSPFFDPEKLTGLAGVEYIRTHEYENTFLKRLLNTYLLAVSRKALNEALPYNAYALAKVQDDLCANETPSLDEPLGNTIALVQKNAIDASKQPIYEGFKLNFHPNAQPSPALGDTCTWFAFEQGQREAFAKAIQYVQATNPPPHGTWVILGGATRKLPLHAVPKLKAEPEIGGSGKQMFNQWTSADDAYTLTWKLLAEPDDAPQAARDYGKVWSYTIDGKPIGLYLTYYNANSSDHIETWRTSSAAFDWESPPEINPNDDHPFIVWANPENIAQASDEIYFVTDGGLPRIGADAHIEKHLDAKLGILQQAYSH